MPAQKFLYNNGNGKKQVLAVVGLGYVGLPLALLAGKNGYEVIGYDIDREKVAKINNREPVFTDEKMAQDIKNLPITATTDAFLLKQADIIVVCVPTPVYQNHTPDLRPLIGAAESLGRHLRKGQNIIIESTVNPGISEAIILPILKEFSGLNAENNDFFFSYCPERINPGDKEWDLGNTPRVIGSLTKESLNAALAFYRSVLKAEIMPMAGIKEAEAVKIVENSFRDINIAFVNELALSFGRMNIDIVNVIKGASTKPFGFMPHYPGCGVGGHCIPVDPYYLIEYAKKNGFVHRFLSLARQINNEMPIHTAELAMSALANAGLPVKGTRIAVLGLAYKSDIDDIRESPSLKIVSHLKKFGIDVTTYDPYVPKLSGSASLEEALRGAKVIIVATAHSQFKNMISPSLAKKFGIIAIIDGRNCLDAEAFAASDIRYTGIGRGLIPDNYIQTTLIAENGSIIKTSA